MSQKRLNNYALIHIVAYTLYAVKKVRESPCRV
jgi:hypothetical protein